MTDGKRCYSYYFHGSKGHSATAKIADGQDYAHAASGVTAKAGTTAGAAYTCYAYWSKDDD
ncbi:lactococcin 972 family bacteriocin [Streptomyces hokutonensis]|uniref:lactococcin 972 family bacteriocin n=1 Tax=Streptomyces hokutonensis TaxID=1306990 RepID=UPI001319BCAD|nr:lactococcin 972 family bacteriocin [Streptomyces hokutonensis]